MDKPQRRAWRATGIKRTRTHSIKLLADSAEEVIQIASNPPYKLKVSDCVEDPPIRSGAGWNFLVGKNLNPRFNTKKG